MTRSLSLTAAYTFSRANDDLPVAAGDGSAFGSAATPAIPWYQPGGHQFDHGLSDLDHAHRLVVSYVWMLPALSKSNRFLRGAFGDWQFSGIATLQTGDPLTVMAGTDRSQTGLNKDRGVEVQGVSPSLSGACANLAPCVNWLNPQAFALPAIGAFGQLGGNVQRARFVWLGYGSL